MSHKPSKLRWAGLLIGAGLLLVGFALPRTSPEVRLNALEIANQPMGGDRTVRVAEVFSETPGWLVVHADRGHRAGPIIGWTHVDAGEHLQVPVRVRLPETLDASGLFVVLHADGGTLGRFEYPGPDAPARGPQGQTIIDRFQLSLKPE